MAGNVYKRYVWLLDLISRNDGITQEDINNKWQRCSLNETGERLPPRTFHNHLQKIYEIFGVKIASTGKDMYRIIDSGDIDLDNSQQSLLAHLQISNALFSNPELAKRISLDGYMSFRYFTPLIEAMEDGKVVELNYLHHEKDCRSYPKIRPYYIKQFERGWFVVGRELKSNAICAYAFSDIIAIRLSEDGEKFDISEIDVAEFMRNPKFGKSKYNNNDLYMKMYEAHKHTRRRNRWGTYTPEGYEVPELEFEVGEPLAGLKDIAQNQNVALYIHGLASGENGSTFQELKKRFPQFHWISADFGENLEQNVKRINSMAKLWNAKLIIGTSFGGLALLYAKTPNIVKVVCNPALSIADCIRNNIGLGEHEYFCKRQDRVQEFELTEDMCKEYEAYIANHPIQLGKENYALFSAHDELLGDEAAEQAQKVVAEAGYKILKDNKGQHRLGKSAFTIIENEVVKKLEFKPNDDSNL